MALSRFLTVVLLAFGLAGAANASCMAPTPRTACPTCALVVIGTYSEVGAPHINIERVVRRRGAGRVIGISVPVSTPWRNTEMPGYPMYMECAFVPVDGWRMRYYLNPDPAKPGHWIVAWGFGLPAPAP